MPGYQGPRLAQTRQSVGSYFVARTKTREKKPSDADSSIKQLRGSRRGRGTSDRCSRMRCHHRVPRLRSLLRSSAVPSAPGRRRWQRPTVERSRRRDGGAACAVGQAATSLSVAGRRSVRSTHQRRCHCSHQQRQRS